MGRRRNIFESVTFLNEGLGTVLMVGIIGFYATGIAIAAGYSLVEKSQQNAVKKALKAVAKRDDIKQIDQRISSIRAISKKELVDKNKIAEKDIPSFTRANISIFAALENDEILACVVVDHDSEKCKYFVSDKSIKDDALAYLYARIELHMEFIGENIKKFVDEKKISLISSSRSVFTNKYSDSDNPDIAILSKDVQDQIYKDLEDVCKESIAFLKSKCKTYKVEAEYNKDYEKGESNEEYLIITITDPRQEENYDEWSDKYMERFYTESKQAVYQLMNKLKLNNSRQNTSTYKGSENIHPFIKIGDYQNNDEDAQYIYIGTVFDDIRNGRS